MDTKLTFSQLAKAIGITPATIGNNVDRGKLIFEIDGKKKYIDISHSMNKAWIDTYCVNNNRQFDINRVLNPVKNVKSQPMEHQEKEVVIIEKEGKSEASILAIKKAKLEVKRLQNNDKLDRLKIEKMQGLLVPTDAASTVFLFSVSTIINTFKQNVTGAIDIIQNKSGISHKEYIELLKEVDDYLNDIYSESIENIKNGLGGVVKEFQEVRSRGESK